jgi:hypothetical protein
MPGAWRARRDDPGGSIPKHRGGEVSMMPTNNLRFVERTEVFSKSADGLQETGRRVRVLQQQWISITSPGHEWRDVPLVAEGEAQR